MHNFDRTLTRLGALALLVAPLIGLTSWAQPAEEPTPTPPAAVDPEPAAAPETVVEPEEPEREPRRGRARRDAIVTIAGDTHVEAGQAAEEVVVVQGNATIEGDIDGDVVVVLGRLKLTGSVDGDVVVVAGEADIDGKVSGDLTMVVTQGELGPNADVRGHIQSVGMAPKIDPAAKMRGSPEVVSLGPLGEYFTCVRDYFLQGVLLMRPFPPRLGWVWLAAGAFLLFHLFLALVLAQPLRACMDTLHEQPARSFLIGLVTCVLVGPVSLLLSFTVVAPLLIWLAFFAACVFGRVVVYGAAGAAVGRASTSPSLAQPLVAVLAGSLLFYVSYMIPFVGMLVYWLVVPLGVGAVLIRLFDALRRERGVAGPAALGAGAGLTAASALAAGRPGPATHAFTPVGEVPPVSPDLGMQAQPAPAAAGTIPPPPNVNLSGAEALAQPRVGFWPRFGAAVIDLILIGIVNALTFEQVKSFWFLLTVYHIVMWSWRGTTLGGAILNLRIVRLDGRPMDWQTAIVRALGAVVSLVPLGLGFFWASWDEQFQSWHDRIAGTTIVKPDRQLSLV